MKVSRNPPVETILSEGEEIFEGNSRSTSIVPAKFKFKIIGSNIGKDVRR